MKIKYLLTGLVFTCTAILPDSGIIDSIEKAGKKLLGPVEQAQKIFPSAVEERQTRLAEVLKERQALEETNKAFLETTTRQLEEIKAQLDNIAASLKKEPEDEFLNKKLSILNEHYQTIKSLQQSREQFILLLDQHSAFLQEYLKDPNLKEYVKELKIAHKDAYTFEDLHALNENIVAKEKTIAQIIEQEKNADAELDNRKRTAQATTEAFKKKKEEQEKPASDTAAPFELSVTQKFELFKLEEQLYHEAQERDALRIREIEQKKTLLKTRLFIERSQLAALKDLLNRVKPAIKVSEADISYAKDELLKKQQQAIIKKEEYHEESESLTKEIKAKEKELQDLSQRHGISLGSDLDDWSRRPTETAQGYKNFLEMVTTNDALLLLHRKKELLGAQATLEDETLKLADLHIKVKSSFHKVLEHAFVSEEETSQELSKYDAPKAELRTNLALFKEKRTTDQDLLNHQKKALVTIKDLRKKIHDKKNSLFKTNPDDYALCLELLNSAEDKVQGQIDILGKLYSLYSDIVVVLSGATKQIEFIISELELTTIWQRSKYAITWEGLQNVIPNLETFAADVKAHLVTFNGVALMHVMQSVFQAPMIFLLLAILILIIILGKLLIPLFGRFFFHTAARYRSLHALMLLLGMITTFLGKHIVSITLWSFIWYFLQHYPATDTSVYVIFYLASIPYLLYLANRLLAYITRFNMQHGYIFIDKDFQQRFIIVVSTFLYATITIFLFREAFMLAAYYKSELPTILLAINFIIFQIALIFLIAKEQILSVIPERGSLWQWTRTQVDRFYYLILMMTIAIIVMSNPYVGFGKLVLYVLIRVLYTFILIRILIWVHMIIKRGLSHVFFSISQDSLRERFAYGKTLYGIFVLGVFLAVLFLGCVIGAKIWGWPENLAKVSQWPDIVSWLQTPVMLEKSENPISVFSILKILTFIMSGFVLASAVNRFILEKIFDVLLADPGVQNTISSLVRYVLIIAALILGFQSVGLGELIWWLILTLGVGIGWVIKDPVGDFIAYFIILVQRPLKIGDYVQIDDQTKGVVRKITPRSVVIRRNNSVTIVLPNMGIINKPLLNWNYARGFIAFDDILITVSYKEDPAKVKEVLFKVLDENPFVLKTPTPVVRLHNFDDTGFVFMVRGFLSSNYTLDQWDIASDVRLALVAKLRQHAIEIAIPTRVIISQALVNETTTNPLSDKSSSNKE